MNMPDFEAIDTWRKMVRQNPPPQDIVEDILSDTNEVNVIMSRLGIARLTSVINFRIVLPPAMISLVKRFYQNLL